MSQAFIDRIREKFGAHVLASDGDATDPWIEITCESLLDVCQFLKETPELYFDMLNCITGIDYLHTDPKKAAKADWQPHIKLVYHLSSITHKHSFVVKLSLPRWKDGVAGSLPEVPSVNQFWRTADWHEREVYDLIGICFTGHPDLRRILCPEDWIGYPLRKDYVLPEEYHGIRCQ